MAICTNYVSLIIFSVGLPNYLLSLDVIFNSFSIYLSYTFTSRYYDYIFSPCHNQCYSCCTYLCFCCCTMNLSNSGDEEMSKGPVTLATPDQSFNSHVIISASDLKIGSTSLPSPQDNVQIEGKFSNSNISSIAMGDLRSQISASSASFGDNGS
eukprot:180136_1